MSHDCLVTTICGQKCAMGGSLVVKPVNTILVHLCLFMGSGSSCQRDSQSFQTVLSYISCEFRAAAVVHRFMACLVCRGCLSPSLSDLATHFEEKAQSPLVDRC